MVVTATDFRENQLILLKRRSRSVSHHRVNGVTNPMVYRMTGVWGGGCSGEKGRKELGKEAENALEDCKAKS